MRFQGVELQRADSAAADVSPSVPVNAVWRTIRSYILWQHERGTLHYDIMVTLILVFIFWSPRVIDYNDKPIARSPHPTEVVVSTDADGRVFYQVSASDITSGDDHAVREQLLQIIEPISGAVSIVSYEAVNDRNGHIQSYKVLVKRE